MTQASTTPAVFSSRRGASAFTLVEILVVIGIIAVLIGILIPVISRANDAAKRTTCMSNMRQLTVAWTEYATHHDGALVGADTSGPGCWVIGGNTRAEIEKGLLFQYCPNALLYHCPADYSDHWRSFSINTYLNGNFTGVPAIRRIDQARRPTQTILFIEEFDVRGVNLNSFVIRNSGNTWVDVPAHFHKVGCTLGFVDDHAEFWIFSDPRTYAATQQQTQAGNADLARFEKGAGY
jgi:type II secretory pathway pseudopilin PulG